MAHRLFVCFLCAGALTICDSSPLRAGVKVGEKASSIIGLLDLHGNSRTLADYRPAKLRVLVFLGTECPVANVYLPVLMNMEKELRFSDVQFLAVYPHATETIDEIAAHSYDRNIPFPVLKDLNAELAESLGVEKVPTVCVIDGEDKLRYRGRIDDQIGISTRRPKATRDDLKEAIKELLSNKEVTTSETLADGCLIVKERPKGNESKVTFAKDVSRILQHRCEECHRAGRIGPFKLASYEDAVDWSKEIRRVVDQRRMPPWHADERFGHFRNDRRLSQKEIDTILAWIDGGHEKGDDRDLPAPMTWVEGWQMGEPDIVLTMPRPQQVPATGVVPYRYIVVPTNFTEDKWIVGAEAKPGNPEVVHHIIIYVLSPEKVNPFDADDGEMSVLTEWAPGDGPFTAAPGTALRIPKGATLLMEMHYTPNGKEQTDQSRVGVKFTDRAPDRIVRANLFANELIRIPANDPHHREEKVFEFAEDARVIAFLPHMHWRGKHFEYIAYFPDGREERLLSVPRWDFNWQTGYWLKEPLRLPKGTKIRAIAHWDNSRYNIANPDPSKEVIWGLQTWEEMMVGWMYYVFEKPDAADTVAARKGKDYKLRSAGMFRVMDRNKDGWVGGKEIPPSFRPMLEGIGIDLEQGLDPVSYDFIYGIIVDGMKRGPHHEQNLPTHESTKSVTPASDESASASKADGTVR